MHDTVMDLAYEWLTSSLRAYPQYLMDLLKTLYNHLVALGQSLLNMSLDSLSLQTILPPIITLFAIYFTIISLYRTTSFFVRATVFIVKWGALISILGIALGYFANVGAPEWLNSLIQPSTARHRSSRTRNAKPRFWDSFDKHRQWQAAQRETAPFGSDASHVVQEIADKIAASIQGGWVSAFTNLAAEQFLRDDTPKGRETRERERALKRVKGKAKSR